MIGLTSREAQERIRQGNDNIQVDSSTRTVKEIVRENICTYFNLIFTVLAVLLIIAGSFKDLTFMIIVGANTIIGIVQELRSKQVLDNLKLMKMPGCHVYRDDVLMEMPIEKLVLDDVILLQTGNQIPADASVIEGSVQVNEAMLTGEADEITKKAGDSLMSGSFVVSGKCLAKLTAVGEKSYIAKLTMEATKENGSGKSEMILSLDRMVKFIGIVIIPVGAILFAQEWWFHQSKFSESIIAMVAAVLGMIPEGLYMTASVAMVVSAIRLAKQEVLVQNMKSIETLARVNVLCVDKTGTITQDGMEVKGMWCRDKDEEMLISRLISDFVANQNPDNATMVALKTYFGENKGTRAATSVCAFSSRYKYSGASFGEEHYVMGAPEFILNADLPLYAERIENLSSQGYRVLAFARTDIAVDGQMLSAPGELLALVFLRNPIRPAAKETFKYFAENDVEVKVISGDNPVTVSHVAEEAGIPNADKYVDASHLVTEKSIYDAVATYTVFGRVTPEQKRMFVKALQKQGKTVGMTGDGVNDILALKDADCSVAMASGSEAASNAAQLVLMDSDFSRMPSVVAEGRRVVNNLQKAATLYLTKNVFSLMLALFSVISVLSYPLKPSQITLISMFTIGVPSFIISLEPNKNLIKGRFIPNVLKMALPAGLTTFISVSSLVVFSNAFKIDKNMLSTSSAMLVALVGFMILIKIARPFNTVRMVMITAMFFGMIYCVLFKPTLFGIDAVSFHVFILLVVFLMATEALFRYIHLLIGLVGRLGKIREERRERKHRRIEEKLRRKRAKKGARLDE